MCWYYSYAVSSIKVYYYQNLYSTLYSLTFCRMGYFFYTICKYLKCNAIFILKLRLPE